TPAAVTLRGASAQPVSVLVEGQGLRMLSASHAERGYSYRTRGLDVVGTVQRRARDGDADAVARHAGWAVARGGWWVADRLAPAVATLEHGTAGRRNRRPAARRQAQRAWHG